MTLQTGAWLYGVHRMCTETAAVLCGASHITTKQCCKHHFGGLQKMHNKKQQSLIQNHIQQECSVSILEWRPVLSKNGQQQHLTPHKSDYHKQKQTNRDYAMQTWPWELQTSEASVKTDTSSTITVLGQQYHGYLPVYLLCNYMFWIIQLHIKAATTKPLPI